MSLDERLFTWIWQRAKAYQPKPVSRDNDPAALLVEQRRALEIFLHGLLDRRVVVETADDEGGWHGGNLLLPDRMDLFASRQDNAFAYRFRVLCEATMLLLWQKGFATQDHNSDTALLLSLPQVFCAMDQHWLGARGWREQVIQLLRKNGLVPTTKPSWFDETLHRILFDPSGSLSLIGQPAPTDPIDQRKIRFKSQQRPLWFKLRPLFASPTRGEGSPFALAPIRDLGATSNKITSEKQGKSAKRPKYAEDSSEANNPIAHVLEKTQTLDSYIGGQRSFDGSDNMKEHSDALDEVDFQIVVRSQGQAGSLVNLEHEGHFTGDVAGGEDQLQARIFPYPEWVDSKQRYVKDWCLLREIVLPLGPDSSDLQQPLVQRQGKRLYARMESLFNRRLWVNRQAEGVELDYDALVYREADLQAGVQTDDRVYLDKRIPWRDLSCVILVDGSMSTDSWVNGIRVMDQMKAALGSLSLAFRGVGFKTEVAAFHSQTRMDCRYQILKAFDDPWTRLGQRLDALQPTGYTRIGPALRHSLQRILQHRARHRLILLLSDAKPTDFDAYEGRHGVKDVRRAVLEAERDDVHVRALTVSAGKNRQIFDMFGTGAVHDLGKSESMADQVFGLFLQVMLQK